MRTTKELHDFRCKAEWRDQLVVRNQLSVRLQRFEVNPSLGNIARSILCK